MDIRHAGLSRLRINAVMTPAPQLTSSRRPELPSLPIGHVSFEPKGTGADPTSTLTIEFKPVPREAPVGTYFGVVRAENFQLLIARVQVDVTAAPAEGVNPGTAVPRASRRG
jgi:hypothetical protein